MTRIGAPTTDARSRAAAPLGDFGPLVALGVLAVLCFLPFLLQPPTRRFLPAYADPILPWLTRGLVLALLLVSIAWITARSGLIRLSPGALVGLMVLAAALTACHWFLVEDRFLQHTGFEAPDYYADRWQRDNYIAVLNRQTDLPNVPHVFRPLPYGFIRSLEWLARDWSFARLAYRWYFTFWFLWGYACLVRPFHSPRQTLLALVPYLVLYPLSVRYYLGQPTDPLSHALFVVAFLYLLQDRWLPLAATLALGVLAKETILIVVPAYAVVYRRRGWACLQRTLLLALAGVAAFLAMRLPLGWSLRYESINGTIDLMVASNLGLPGAKYKGYAPLYQNYLQPLLCVGIFLPFIARNWKQADERLKTLWLVLTPLLLASSLCFGWLYESRNYIPLLPLCIALALPPRAPGGTLSRQASDEIAAPGPGASG